MTGILSLVIAGGPAERNGVPGAGAAAGVGMGAAGHGVEVAWLSIR